MTSWVIREKATGRVVGETFNDDLRKTLCGRYEAVPILEYLQQVNRAIKANPPEQS